MHFRIKANKKTTQAAQHKQHTKNPNIRFPCLPPTRPGNCDLEGGAPATPGCSAIAHTFPIHPGTGDSNRGEAAWNNGITHPRLAPPYLLPHKTGSLLAVTKRILTTEPRLWETAWLKSLVPKMPRQCREITEKNATRGVLPLASSASSVNPVLSAVKPIGLSMGAMDCKSLAILRNGVSVPCCCTHLLQLQPAAPPDSARPAFLLGLVSNDWIRIH